MDDILSDEYNMDELKAFFKSHPELGKCVSESTEKDEKDEKESEHSYLESELRDDHLYEHDCAKDSLDTDNIDNTDLDDESNDFEDLDVEYPHLELESILKMVYSINQWVKSDRNKLKKSKKTFMNSKSFKRNSHKKNLLHKKLTSKPRHITLSKSDNPDTVQPLSDIQTKLQLSLGEYTSSGFSTYIEDNFANDVLHIIDSEMTWSIIHDKSWRTKHVYWHNMERRYLPGRFYVDEADFRSMLKANGLQHMFDFSISEPEIALSKLSNIRTHTIDDIDEEDEMRNTVNAKELEENRKMLLQVSKAHDEKVKRYSSMLKEWINFEMSKTEVMRTIRSFEPKPNIDMDSIDVESDDVETTLDTFHTYVDHYLSPCEESIMIHTESEEKDVPETKFDNTVENPFISDNEIDDVETHNSNLMDTLVDDSENEHRTLYDTALTHQPLQKLDEEEVSHLCHSVNPWRTDIIEYRTFQDWEPFKFQVVRKTSGLTRTAAERKHFSRRSNFEISFEADVNLFMKHSKDHIGNVISFMNDHNVGSDDLDDVCADELVEVLKTRCTLFNIWREEWNSMDSEECVLYISLVKQMLEHVGALFGWYRPWRMVLNNNSEYQMCPSIF